MRNDSTTLSWSTSEISSGQIRFTTSHRGSWERFLRIVGLDVARECEIEFSKKGAFRSGTCLVPAEYAQRFALGLRSRF